MKHPTMEDVARAASVSRALVSLVFRGSPKVAPETRDRVLAAADRLNYRPNAMARGLASQRANVVAVLVHDLHNPFFAEIIDGLEAVADDSGLHLLLGHGRGTPHERGVLESLLEYRPSGVVLLSPDEVDARLDAQLNGIPAVIVGRVVRRANMDVVVTDDRKGAGLAVDHLVELGHRRIAHISGGRVEAGARQRIAGYRQRMTELGLGRQAQVITAAFREEAGFAAVDELLQLPEVPTAVFAANDLIAIGLISGLADRGIKIPDDVSVVAYDNSALARLRPIDLTSVAQPLEEIGRVALDLLVERITGTRTKRRTVRMTPTLAIGSTTAPPASTSGPTGLVPDPHPTDRTHQQKGRT